MSISQLSFPLPEIAHCEICGSSAVRVDEVQSGGRLLLAECGRCDHRFTGRVESWRASYPSEGSAGWQQAGAEAEVATAA